MSNSSVNNQVFIRVDGGATIGMGHITRCIAIANMIKSQFSVYFICREIPDNIKDQIIKIGFSVVQIQEEVEWLQKLKGQEIIVLDNYELNRKLQHKIKETGNKLVCIDDTNEHDFVADLIINHSPGIYETNYSAQPYTKYALGLKYALLRPAFLKAAKKIKKTNLSKTVFICFGGSDERNLTSEVLKIVLSEKKFDKIIVVIGISFQHKKELSKIIDGNQNIEFYSALDEDNMVDCLERSTFAIIPSSSILLECLAVGCKAISGYYVDNQKLIYSYFRNSKIIIDAKKFDGKDILKAIRTSDLSITSTSDLIDGKSNKRILHLFTELACTVREAKVEDALVYYNWVNDPAVRQSALKTESILWEHHLNWFEKKMTDNSSKLFVLEFKNLLVGQVRYEFENNYWKIDYSIDSKHRGLGLGKIIIAKTLNYIEGDIKAWVKKENIASNKIFQKLEFRKIKSEFDGLNGYCLNQ